MATAIRPLRKMQMGIEGTKGTLVAATRVIVGDGVLIERRQRYRSTYPRGYRANVGGAGVLVKQWSEIAVDTELSAEQILWPLRTGVRGSVSGTNSNNAFTYTFTPQLNTGVVTLDSATVEFTQSDGSSAHYYGEAGYAMTESFKIDSTPEDIAKLSWKMFGRARQTDTITGALTEYSSLETLVGQLLSVYCDTTWAGLGGTQLTGIQRAVSFDCTTGLKPDFTADGRSDKDFSKHSVNSLAAKLNITWEFDSVGAARYASYRANDIVYIRLKWTGGTAGDAGTKTVQIDGAYRFVDDPQFSYDGDQVLASFNLESVLDTTSSKTLEFTAINSLSAIT